MRRFCVAMTVLLLLSVGLFSAESSAGDVKSPTVIAGSVFTSADPLLTLKAVTLKPGAVRKARVKQLLAGLNAIRDRGLRMSKKRKLQIVEAALYAQSKTGVDAMLMLAVARMESDFRGLTLINAACKYKRRTMNCHADCGMTQHHVRGSLVYVTRQCNKLKRNLKYSFHKSAQELARHVTWCKTNKRNKDKRLRRCVLNRYNMGPFYKTKKRCKRWHNPWRGVRALRRQPGERRRAYRVRIKALLKTPHWKASYKSIKRQQWKCRHRAAYWTKVTCFEYGARNATKSLKSCRRCTALSYIRTKFYKTPQVLSPLTSFLFPLSATKRTP